jgi:diazepam-binding inhibitor (GABA receptor modulating acyl-CoA-binding protein)
MSLQAAFQQAQEQVKTLSQRPSNDTLLELYALFKQGTQGNVSGARPGMFSVKDRAKYDAWGRLKGTDQDSAKQQYVELVHRLLSAQ